MVNRRRFCATTRMKLPASPPIFALCENGVDRLHLVVGRKHRRADQPHQIVAAAHQRVETGEVGLDRVERLGLERQFEQRRGVAFSNSGRDRVGCSHGCGLFR